MNRTQGAAVTQFVYDGAMIAEELDGSGNLLRRYVPGPDGTPLVWYEGAGTGDRRWPIEDRQGSVIAVANGSGQSLATNTYDAYGLAGSSNLGRFQYAGRPFIPEVGLYDNAARSYSPTLGRFLQTDPAGYADGLNWYAYTHGDPVNEADPTGLAVTDTDMPKVAIESGTLDIPDPPIPEIVVTAQRPVTFSFNFGQTAGAAEGFISSLGRRGAALIAGTAKHIQQHPIFSAIEFGTIIANIPDGEAGTIPEILAEESIAAESAEMVGEYSSVTDITTGNSVLNTSTNVGSAEFQANLQANGCAVTESGRNSATVLSNGDGSTYSFYTRNLTGSYGVQHTGTDGQVLKYSLGGP